jgi:hypothetical protein
VSESADALDTPYARWETVDDGWDGFWSGFMLATVAPACACS